MTPNDPNETGRPGARWLLLAAILGIHAALTYRFWWVTDDAYISFRFARNLALGEGLRFNLWDQPPIEGYSNFLWVALAAGFRVLGLDMVVWMPVVSWLCGALLLALLMDRLVNRLEVPLPIAAVAVLGLASYPPFAMWSTSGLATMPFSLLLLLVFDRLVLTSNGPRWVQAGICGALLALIRVEGVAWFGVVLVLAALSQLLRRRLALGALARSGLIVAVVCGAHFAWRYSYYGEWLPNTVHAKSVSGPEFLERGFRYVMANALTFVTPFLIIPGALLALRRTRIASGLGVAALAWAFPVYAVVVSGDYMPMGRFLVPGLAFATILVAWLLTDLAGRSARPRLAVGAGVVLAVIGVVPAWDMHVVPESYRTWCNYRMKKRENETTEYARWRALDRKVKAWLRRGKVVRAFADERLEPPVSMAIRALGAIGYETDFLMYDCAGLIVPEIARKEVTSWVDQPGHDKAVELKYFAKHAPTILRAWFIGDDESRSIVERVQDALNEWQGRDVRSAYRPELVRMIPADGGAGAFLLLLVHEDQSPTGTWRGLTRLTPADLERVPEITYGGRGE